MKFNYLLGRDIVEMRVEERWGENVINQLSMDLKKEMPTTDGLSVTNLRYCRRFYLLSSQALIIHPQVGGELEKIEFIQDDSPIFQIPWGHHKLIMDKVKGNLDKAFFFISQTIKNGWSRSVLQNGIESELYERSGKSINNFSLSLPDISSELAQELTKDPYNFAFAGITKHHNETELKSALMLWLRITCYGKKGKIIRQ